MIKLRNIKSVFTEFLNKSEVNFKLQLVILCLIVMSFARFSQAEDQSLNIGGKVFTEQNILVDILKAYLESNSYKINTNKNLGGTFVAYEALKQGSLDLYVEYSGTSYHLIFDQKKILDRDSTYLWLKAAFEKEGLVILKDLGFSNSYSLITDKNLSIQKISDIRNLKMPLRIGFEHEVLSRPDGYENLLNHYGLKFQTPKTMNVGLMYEAIKNKQLDIGFGYTTDGRNVAYNLKILEDDLNFFPKYYASILVRRVALEKHPTLLNLLSKLSGSISDAEMTVMNYEVDVKKRSSSEVAKDFLIQKNLISVTEDESKLIQRTYFGLRSDELKTLKVKFLEHIKISGVGLLISIFFGFLLGILAFEFKPLKPLVFAFINIFQTVPSLALLGFLIPFLGIGFLPSLVALVIYSLLPLVHNIYIGISEVEPEIIESCKAIGMTNRQILTQVRIPMAMPTIGAGLRTCTVILISTTTVAAFIGAGGLGELIFQGISSLNHRLILLGAVPAALLAFFADYFVHKISLFMTSPGLKRK